MKKTVSIQISGLPFIIDDDAYARLDEYLAGIRAHFSGLEDADEIVQDIESRIAEQFSDRLKKSKKVINLQDVEELVASMGTVADIAEYEDEPQCEHQKQESEKEEKSWKSQERSIPFFSSTRRLYRDPDDQVIAGVASGIAQYFGIDPVIVRILFVVFIFANGLGLIAYIVLWIAVPEAKTISDRVDMKGEPVTLSNLQEEIAEGTREVDVPEFTSVRASGGIRLRIRHGKEQVVIVRGAKRDTENIRASVRGGELTFDRASGSWFSNMVRGFGGLTVDIVTPHLAGLHISGACRAEVEGVKGDTFALRVSGASKADVDAQVKNLSAHVDGASKLSLRGSGDVIDLQLFGASRADTSSFSVKEAHVQVGGASSASVMAGEKMSGTVRGASSVGYQGSPVVEIENDMSSSVKQSWAMKAHHGHSLQQVTKSRIQTVDAHVRTSVPGRVTGGAVKTGSALGRFIVKLAEIAVRLIGAAIAFGAGVALFALAFATLYLLFTGGAPHFDLSPLEFFGFPLYYVLLAAGFVLAFVPLVFLAQLGGSIASLRNSFSKAGTITLSAFWIAALLTVAVTGAAVGPSLEHRFEEIRAEHMGERIDRTLDVRDFTSINVGGALRLNVMRGDTFFAVVHGSERDVNAVTVDVTDGRLTIGREPFRHKPFCVFCGYDETTVDVTLPELTALELSGASRGMLEGFADTAVDQLELRVSGASRLDGDVRAETVIAELSGASRIILRGTGAELHVRASGASRIEASEYSVVRSIVNAAGASRMELNANQEITGEMSGASRLFHVPHDGLDVDVRTSGASRVELQGVQDEEWDEWDEEHLDYDEPKAPESPEAPESPLPQGEPVSPSGERI